MYVNPDRPLEVLIGENYAIVRQILGRIHISVPRLEAVRKVRSQLRSKKYCRTLPIALRRGLIKCILDEWKANRDMYNHVMLGCSR